LRSSGGRSAGTTEPGQNARKRRSASASREGWPGSRGQTSAERNLLVLLSNNVGREAERLRKGGGGNFCAHRRVLGGDERFDSCPAGVLRRSDVCLRRSCAANIQRRRRSSRCLGRKAGGYDQMRDRRGGNRSPAGTGCSWLPERRRIIFSQHTRRRNGRRSLRREVNGAGTLAEGRRRARAASGGAPTH